MDTNTNHYIHYDTDMCNPYSTLTKQYHRFRYAYFKKSMCY